MATEPLLFHALMFPYFYDFFLNFLCFPFLGVMTKSLLGQEALMFILQFTDARPTWKRVVKPVFNRGERQFESSKIV